LGSWYELNMHQIQSSNNDRQIIWWNQWNLNNCAAWRKTVSYHISSCIKICRMLSLARLTKHPGCWSHTQFSKPMTATPGDIGCDLSQAQCSVMLALPMINILELDGHEPWRLLRTPRSKMSHNSMLPRQFKSWRGKVLEQPERYLTHGSFWKKYILYLKPLSPIGPSEACMCWHVLF